MQTCPCTLRQPSATLDETVYQDLRNWLAVLIQPDTRLGGHSICPFAHLAHNVTIEVSTGAIVPPQTPFDVVIYVMPDHLKLEALTTLCQQLNDEYPALVFLADARDRITEINGAVTSNGKHNLILCQPKDKLRHARRALARTRYYQYWNSDYLQEILGDDYGAVMGNYD